MYNFTLVYLKSGMRVQLGMYLRHVADSGTGGGIISKDSDFSRVQR